VARLRAPGTLPILERVTRFVGTAGWSIPAATRHAFPDAGPHLERYASVFPAVEINSSFYRPHQRKTYERWAASTPAGFRFAVKVPKSITHVQKLQPPYDDLERFLGECTGLGEKLGPLLVQLPPSLTLGPYVSTFFAALRERFSGRVACEPRHSTFFASDALWDRFDIARVAADPPRHPRDGAPYGPLRYFRLHGTPRVYYSAYPDEWLDALDVRDNDWCIFDNTALGHATADALHVMGGKTPR
jgi:uncharacterized protein YecE (DUF72 family)